MIKTHIINLDIVKGIDAFEVIKVVERDTGSNLFLINLLDNGTHIQLNPNDLAEINFKYVNGLLVTQTCEVLNSRTGELSVLLDDEVALTLGKVKCEVVIRGQGTQRKSFPLFNITVADDVY